MPRSLLPGALDARHRRRVRRAGRGGRVPGDGRCPARGRDRGVVGRGVQPHLGGRRQRSHLQPARHRQALSGRACARPCQPRHPPQRGGRADRRERRREIDTGEDAVRPSPAQCRHVRMERRTGHVPRPEGRAPARHRHGLPAFQPVPSYDSFGKRDGRTVDCARPFKSRSQG